MAMYGELKKILRNLLESEDDEGCSADLTVVSKDAIEQLRAWRRVNCEDNPRHAFKLISNLDANNEVCLESKNHLDAVDEAFERLTWNVVRCRH